MSEGQSRSQTQPIETSNKQDAANDEALKRHIEGTNAFLAATASQPAAAERQEQRAGGRQNITESGRVNGGQFYDPLLRCTIVVDNTKDGGTLNALVTAMRTVLTQEGGDKSKHLNNILNFVKAKFPKKEIEASQLVNQQKDKLHLSEFIAKEVATPNLRSLLAAYLIEAAIASHDLSGKLKVHQENATLKVEYTNSTGSRFLFDFEQGFVKELEAQGKFKKVIERIFKT